MKEISGSGKRTLDTAIKKKKSQSTNFILDIKKSKLTEKEAIEQLKSIFNNISRKWVKQIILKCNENIILILEQKRE